MPDKRERLKRELDIELDRELEATFPASDPLKITLSSPRVPDLEHDGQSARRRSTTS
jgi:hypothetical protein